MSESTTITTESGAFIRKTVRKGKKRRQKTVRMTKNQKKVILCKIGDFEVYVYPYDYPDTVFMGEFPVSTQIERGTEPQFFRAYNLIRAYFSEAYFNNDGKRKATNARRRTIQKAYNLGLKDKTEAKKPHKKLD